MTTTDAEQAKRIAEIVSVRLERSKTAIPVGISNRHLHLAAADWEVLFGKDIQPKKLRDLGQPGFYACHETVDIEGPKGRIARVRLIGPFRAKTQIEVSLTDASALGVKPPVRESGQLQDSSPIRVTGAKASLSLKEGLIISRRHLHLHPSEAKTMGIKDAEVVRIRSGIGGIRELVFEQVLVRVSDKFAMEFHLDTDEANAAGVKSGDNVHIC